MLTSEEMRIESLAARLHWVPSYPGERLHSYSECLARAALHFEQMRMLLSPATYGHDDRHQSATHSADAREYDVHYRIAWQPLRSKCGGLSATSRAIDLKLVYGAHTDDSHSLAAADDDGVCEFIRVHLGLSAAAGCQTPRCTHERGAQGTFLPAESQRTRAYFTKRARAPERRKKASRKAARKERDVGRPRNATLCDDENESEVE
jgi:hypothetical protein